MYQREIDNWLRANGGANKTEGQFYKNRSEKRVPIKTTDAYGKEQTTYEKHIIWTAHNGQVLDVVEPDEPPKTQDEAKAAADAGKGIIESDGSYSPDYREAARGDPDNTDTRSPEVKSQQAAQHAEAEWNRANGPTPDPSSPAYDPKRAGTPEGGSGIYETHTARIEREARASTQAGQEDDRRHRIATEGRQAETDAARLEIERKRADTEAGRAARQDETAAQAAANDAERIKIEQQRADRENKGRNTIVGSGDYRNPTVLGVNDVTGETYQVNNPNYDPIRVEAEKQREELKLGIEAGKFSAETAAQKYKEWYDKNVTAPIALAQEKRQQAAEVRNAQEAADRREQAKSQNEIERAKVGQLASESAQANERAMLPFMAGPQFGEQFSGAVNSLAKGGNLGNNASAGVNFTADAFEFNRPNFKRIAKQATAEALKHLTPYNPYNTSYAVADYTGLTMPNSETLTQAPASYTPSAGLQNAVNAAQATVPAYVPPPPVTSP